VKTWVDEIRLCLGVAIAWQSPRWYLIGIIGILGGVRRRRKLASNTAQKLADRCDTTLSSPRGFRDGRIGGSAGCGDYCYEILIGERLVRQMKKYKEAMEERSVYSADSFVLAYLFTDGQTDRLNTENFTMPGSLRRHSPSPTRIAFRLIPRHAI